MKPIMIWPHSKLSIIVFHTLVSLQIPLFHSFNLNFIHLLKLSSKPVLLYKAFPKLLSRNTLYLYHLLHFNLGIIVLSIHILSSLLSCKFLEIRNYSLAFVISNMWDSYVCIMEEVKIKQSLSSSSIK